MTEKTDRLVDELKNVEDSQTRNTVFATLFSRIAAGHESKEPGSERVISPNLDAAWTASAEHLNKIVTEEGPEAAFSAAIEMSLLPEGNDEHQRVVNNWIRGTGIAFAGADDNRERLGNYLQDGDKRQELTSLLDKIMNNDLDKFKEFDDFYNPLGFLTIQTIYTVLGLEDATGKENQDLFKKAVAKKDLPETRNAVDILKDIPGCEYITDRI